MKEAGHIFLARMGKKRLRPGGKVGTEWLLARGGLKPGTRVLEAACNMGTTAMELASRYGCSVTACDLDETALEKAEKNVRAAGLAGRITLMKADATDLPFDDASFDVVLNEAMLTMLSQNDKEKAVSGYFRVLRPGGVLLTHDVVLVEASPEEQKQIIRELSLAINVSVFPLIENGWKELFANAGFASMDALTGRMTLMSVGGLLHDEGVVNAIRVVFNGMKPENRAMFTGMRNVLMKRRKQLGFIAVAARKAA